MPMNMPLPTKAKITAFVWSGRSRPKETNWRFRFAAGKKSWMAASSPADMPTIPQITVAIAKARTIRLSYLNVSTFIGFNFGMGLGFLAVFGEHAHGRSAGVFELAGAHGPNKGGQKRGRDRYADGN